jgi:surface polysaccharide O-acyltransferase-like enzyme
MSRSSLALHNLRGVVIIIVLAFHSSLAYVSWISPPTTSFNSPPYIWRAFPIVDSHRFMGLDLLCAWQDVYLMAFMFFLSGLFVWPSLKRRTTWIFIRDRVLRLGVPYIFGIATLIPIATYPAYLVTAEDPSVTGYWHALLSLPFWPTGPLWFLFQLLVLNIVAALLNWVAPAALPALGAWSRTAGTRIGPYLAVLLAASALAYVPLALIFTPWTWTNFWIFAVQWCRPLLYAVYFFAGVGVGVAGLDHGLVAVDGPLDRRWGLWLAAAVGSLALWMGLTGLTLDGHASIGLQIVSDLSFVVACASGCFFFIAMALRFGRKPAPFLGSLGNNAYALYLLHYVFVVWVQYALLPVPLFAVFKAAIVFGITLLCTWFTAVAVQRVPLGARLIGSPPRVAAGFAP